ncbi:MAG: LysR family transcriptional regulator [Sphingomonas sp.]|nr:LysR family transcriptional regulator [Sphingomonas sp.]
MMRLPDLEAWAIFAKVAEHGSFARTAEELRISKPTVSKAITRLENRLNVPLFHRTSRKLTLTETGRAVLDHARQILEEGVAAEAASSAQAATPSGLVRMTAPMSLGILQLAPLIPKFLEQYPEVALDLYLSDAHEDLVARGYDLALRVAALPDSSLRARKLREVRRPMVAAPTYLERHGRPSHPIELEQHSGIHYSNAKTPDLWRLRHRTAGEWTVRVPSRLQANNADVIVPALVAGVGIAMQPDFVVWRELASGALEEILSEWSAPPIGMYLVTPPGSLRPLSVQVLIDFLVEYLGRSEWPGAGP